MLKNYLKVAFRNLLRNKAFSIINIAGLAIGMASAILIFLWIQHQVSYDGFHEKKDRIYEVWNRAFRKGDSIAMWNTTPKILAKNLQRDVPDIETTCRVNWNSDLLFSIGEKRVTERGNIVDSTFLQVFTFPLLKGNPGIALAKPSSIVITEKLAKKLFGNEEAMGKMVMLENKDNFTVTGILKDMPNNTRFGETQYLIPWEYLRREGGDDANWDNNSTRTYALLKPNTSAASVNTKIREMRKKYESREKGGFYLYNASRWHLYSNFENGKEVSGLIDLVRLFGIIAAFILLIACINFMNLSSARSEKRSKEVGIRKVVGAQKRSIISQFLGESILLTFFAGVLSLMIVYL